MKVYKFRSVTNEQELQRLKEIVGTGRFWCSSFSTLNDPMEGVFTVFDRSRIADIYDKKKSFKICSFSRKEAVSNPALWGYYAGGFLGVAIEVEVSDSEVHEVHYVSDIRYIENQSDEIVKTILTTKLFPWSHEAEFRFLAENVPNSNVIGAITALYVGNPYGNVVNQQDIIADNLQLETYKSRINDLITCSNIIGIKCFAVRVVGTRVVFDGKEIASL